MAEEPMSEPTPPRAPGRPRDPELDERVVTAVRELLVEAGWEGTTVRQVAERSGVSRPAIARRWSSKAQLVFEALLGPEPDLTAFATVDREGWIDGVVDGAFDLFSRPEMRKAVPGLLAALDDHEGLRTDIWDRFSGPATALLADDEVDAEAHAAIVIAAGSALFASVMLGEQAREGVRSQVRALLQAAPAQARSPG